MKTYLFSLLFSLVFFVSSITWAHPTVFILLDAQEALPLDPKGTDFQLIKGVDRSKEPVTFGVPLPNDTNAFEATQVIMLKASGYQLKVLKRWPSQRVQWLLVDALVDLKANGQTSDMFLTSGLDPAPTPMATETDQTITIPTGAATFSVSKTTFRLLDQVVIDGKDLLKGSPTAGIVLTALDDTQYFASLDQKAKVIIEENGPVRVTVRAEGMHASAAGKDLLDFTVRMHFYKGKQRVKLVYTLRNASKRRLEHVQFKSVELVLQSAWEQPSYLVRDHQGESKGQLTKSEKMRLFQGENAYPTIRDKGFDKAHWPTGISGYQLTVDGKEIKRGTRDEFIQLFYAQSRAADGRALMAGTRFAAGHWPQGLGVDGDGSVRIGLFPTGNDKPYVIRFGSHITRECVLSFEAKADASPRDEFFRFQYPIVVKPSDPDWFNQDEMLFLRLVSFKEEAAFLKDKGWPFESGPDDTLKRRPQFAIPRFIDWGLDVLSRRISPLRINTVNYLRELRPHNGAYYLAAQQRAQYDADQSILHSDDFDDRRVLDEVPGLRDGKGGVKKDEDLPGADKLPPFSVRWTDKNLHGYGMSLWYHISGDRRLADAYFDWGEHMLRRSANNPDAHTLGMNLFNLVELFRFTRQSEYYQFAWGLLEREVLDKSAVAGVSGGTDRQRGAYVGADQATQPDRKISTFAQARALTGAYALFLENATDELQADRARDQLEGISRFVASELWRQVGTKPGEYGTLTSSSFDQAPPTDPRLSTAWSGGVDDSFMAMYFGYLMTSEFEFLRKGEMLLQAAALNPGMASWFQDLSGRQMLQYLIENTVLYAAWRPLPVETSMLQGGNYHVTLLAPFGARQYWIKYADKKIVPSLGFDPVTRTYKYDPKTHTPFFAATNLKDEPKPVDPGIYQAIRVTGLEPGKTYYFAARYLTSDPRPPLSEPVGEPLPDAGTLDAAPGDEPALVDERTREEALAAQDGDGGSLEQPQGPEQASTEDGLLPAGGACAGCGQAPSMGSWWGLWLLLIGALIARRKQLNRGEVRS